MYPDRQAPDLKTIGLHLALCTQSGDDAISLKKELIRCLILNLLIDKERVVSVKQIATDITRQLHLASQISHEYLTQNLSSLASDGLVTIENDSVMITDSGKDWLKESSEKAIFTLFEGRNDVRKALEQLTGHKFTESHYHRIWDVFQDGIAELFYSHGLAIIRMVRSVLNDKHETFTDVQALSSIESLAGRIAKQCTDPTQASEVKQAIMDIFVEKSNPAFQWLTQVCSIFVMLCSLGLENISNQQVITVLSSYRLVPDSDILISLLCEGENNHKDVKQIINSWIAIGGTLYLAKQVLEEVAYHAWISEYDYSFFGPDLYQLSEEKAEHEIDNAFVRTFKKLAGTSTSEKYWNHYINQYKGTADYDYHKIYQVLKDEYNFEILPDSEQEYKATYNDIKAYMLRRVSTYTNTKPEFLDKRIIGKTERDAQLVISIYAVREAQKASGVITTTCVISSANLLKDTDLRFRRLLGDPEMVLSISSVAFLLTFCPQVHMGIGTLRSVLFDSGLATRLTSAQRYAYRVIAASTEHEMPWSKRVTLQKELSSVLLQDARQRGESFTTTRDRFSAARDQGYVAKVVSQVIDRMALTPKTKKELIETKARVARLEDIEELISKEPKDTFKKPKTKQFKTKKRKH